MVLYYKYDAQIMIYQYCKSPKALFTKKDITDFWRGPYTLVQSYFRLGH
jgi:hypothetical protein